MKSYKDKEKTDFHDKKIPKQGFHCIGLSMILFDSFVEKDKKYYLKVFLDECDYVVK